MEPSLTLQLILQHLSVSLIPWLIIMVIGGGLGYGFSFLIHRWLYDHKWLLNILVFLPWRSVIIWIALVAIHSPLMIWQFGLGPISASVAIGIALCVFIIPSITVILLQSLYPPSSLGKIMSIARTSAILSIALVVLLDTGMGYYILRVSSSLGFQKIILAYLVVGAMMLGIDLVLGFIQIAVLSSQSRSVSFDLSRPL